MENRGTEFSFRCSCGKSLKVHSNMEGRKGRCPACGKRFLIPSAPRPVNKVADDHDTAIMPPPSQYHTNVAPPPQTPNTRVVSTGVVVALLSAVGLLIFGAAFLIGMAIFKSRETPKDEPAIAETQAPSQETRESEERALRNRPVLSRVAPRVWERESRPFVTETPRTNLDPPESGPDNPEKPKERQPKGRENETLAETYKRVQASVVTVETEFCWGTGFVLDADKRLIATNRHVIEGGGEITIIFHDARSPGQTTASVIRVHKTADIAIVKVGGSRPLPPAVKLGNTDSVQPADPIFTVGSPGSGLGAINKGILAQTVTKGIISGVKRDYKGTKCFQIDAALNHGNSGGPLFNEKGEVIGVNTYSRGDFGKENLNFAIYVDYLRELESGRRKSLSKKEINRLVNDRADIHFKMGMAAFGKDRFNEAAQHFTRAIKQRKDYARAYLMRGLAYSMLGENELATSDFEKSARLDPQLTGEISEMYRRIADGFNKAGNYEGAIFFYGKAIEISPKDSSLYCARGHVFYSARKYDKAIEDFTSAIKLDRKSSYAYYMRGWAYHGRTTSSKEIKQDYGRSIADFKQALKLKPGDELIKEGLAVAYCNRGVYYLRDDKPKTALRDFNEAIRCDSDVALYYSNRAVAYERLGKTEKARKDRQRARRLGNNR